MLEASVQSSSSTLLPLLSDRERKENFARTKPPMGSTEALIEAARCLFCHDAPCITACPARIDVPMFIRQIMTQNLAGAAKTIFTQNILGRSCGTICPTEVLCEGACVYNGLNEKPIDIGRLQAFATDHAIQNNIRFWERGQPTGKKIAIVGGGPAGLACAHELSILGYEVALFDSNQRIGGLNAYGIAPYKCSNEDVAEEAAYIAQTGFSMISNRRVLASVEKNENGDSTHRSVLLPDLEAEYDAIFLAMGLGESKRLGIPGEELPQVYGAIEFIRHLREEQQRIQVGREIVVIGAGNTAMDTAIECAKLGAEVTIVYRRSLEDQNAYAFEVEHAQKMGIRFLYLASPLEIIGNHSVEGLRCIRNRISGEKTELQKAVIQAIPHSEFIIPCTMIIVAAGRESQSAFLQSIPGLMLQEGKIAVNEDFQTGNPKYFAGGDCVNGGKEVVNAVAHGRDAARGIHRFLSASLSPQSGAGGFCHG